MAVIEFCRFRLPIAAIPQILRTGLSAKELVIDPHQNRAKADTANTTDNREHALARCPTSAVSSLRKDRDGDGPIRPTLQSGFCSVVRIGRSGRHSQLTRAGSNSEQLKMGLVGGAGGFEIDAEGGDPIVVFVRIYQHLLHRP